MPPRTRKTSIPRRSAARTLRATTFDFARPATLVARLSELRLTPKQAVANVAALTTAEPAKAEMLAHAMLVTPSTDPTTAEQTTVESNSRELLLWASAGKTECRRIVVRAFGRAAQKYDLLYGIGQLQKAPARAFVKDYIEADGDLAAVAGWLGEVGETLATIHGSGAPTDGLWGAAKKIAGKATKAVGDAIGSAASAVVDGIETAGKSIGEIMAHAASWTADKVAHLVRALVEAGKAAAEILASAVAHGLEMVRGAVQGLLAAGRLVAEVVDWAARQSIAIATAAVDAALDLGCTVASVLDHASTLLPGPLQRIAQAIIRSGRKAAEVLAGAGLRSLEVMRTIVDGMIAIGINLTEVVAGVCKSVAEGFRKGWIAGLVAAGHGLVAILRAAFESGLAIAALAFTAILEFLGGHRPLLPNEIAAARLVFGWSIDLTRVKVGCASLPADLINEVNGSRPFTTMYVLNFSSKSDFKSNGEVADMPSLIHELAHVWQGVQSGPIYMIQALESQMRSGAGAYDYTAAQLGEFGGDLLRFGREQQAQIVGDYYYHRYGGGKADQWQVLEPYAKKVYRAKQSVLFPGRVILPIPGPLPLPRPLPRQPFGARHRTATLHG